VNKKRDISRQSANVLSVGTELMLPANMPPIFPVVSCKDAEIIFNFDKEKFI